MDNPIKTTMINFLGLVLVIGGVLFLQPTATLISAFSIVGLVLGGIIFGYFAIDRT